MKLTKALILDFDGTIRRSKSGKTFIEGPEDIELMPGVERLISRYKQMGYLIFGISNQAGVAHGFKKWWDCDNEMKATMKLFKDPGTFNAVKWCYHDERGTVDPYNHRSLGRKPDIGMLYEMEVDCHKAGYIVDWDNSLFVGDRPEDEECAKRAGIQFRHIDHFLTQPHEFSIPA